MYNPTIKKCAICGMQFTSAKSNTKKYCSVECVVEAKRLRCEQNRRFCAERKRHAGEKNKSIVEIDRRAKDEGLTYGQYVAKYGI